MNLIKIILGLCSPAIRDAIKVFLGVLRKNAAATDNDVDDILVQVLYSVLGFDYKHK